MQNPWLQVHLFHQKRDSCQQTDNLACVPEVCKLSRLTTQPKIQAHKRALQFNIDTLTMRTKKQLTHEAPEPHIPKTDAPLDNTHPPRIGLHKGIRWSRDFCVAVPLHQGHQIKR